MISPKPQESNLLFLDSFIVLIQQTFQHKHHFWNKQLALEGGGKENYL